jgi:hypothetical protein
MSGMSDQALQRIADELRNVRKGVDWNAPGPGSLYAALRQIESVARLALGQPLPQDFNYKGRYTTLEQPEQENAA